MLHVAMRPASRSGSTTDRTSGRVSRRVRALLSARYSAIARSPPGPGHHVGIVEVEALVLEEEVDKLSSSLEGDHLVEGGVDGVGEGGRAEHVLGPLDLGEVDLERGLAALRIHEAEDSVSVVLPIAIDGLDSYSPNVGPAWRCLSRSSPKNAATGRRRPEPPELKTLTALNPDVDVVTHDVRLGADNIVDILSGYDVVVDGTDNFPVRYLVNDASLKVGVPVVHGSIFRFEGQATVFTPTTGRATAASSPKPPDPARVSGDHSGLRPEPLTRARSALNSRLFSPQRQLRPQTRFGPPV